jgi:predicted HAD superfamily Cof-like phosphohydrolase
MNDYLNKVSEFHKAFDAPILNSPQIPKDRAELRYNLIKEELDELLSAIKNNDIVEAADALADIQYVLSGAILEFGLSDKFDDLFNEVQRSNMSKACSTIEEAEQTINFYLKKDGTKAYWKEKEGKYLVHRTDDDKLLKSINYSPADLKKIIG